MNFHMVNPSTSPFATTYPSLIVDTSSETSLPESTYMQKIKTNVHSLICKSSQVISTIRKQTAPLLAKIKTIALTILTVSLGVMFYWVNNSLFAFSLLVGIIRHVDVIHSINKIKAVWETQPFSAMSLGLVGSVLSLQVTLATGSILFAAGLGAHLSKRAQEIYAEREINAY